MIAIIERARKGSAMNSTITNRRDLDFLLYDVFDLLGLTAHDHYADHDKETLDAVIDTAQKIAEDHFLPHAALVDEEEPTFLNGKVAMRPEVKKALTHYYEAGFLAAPHEYDLGGMQLPHMVSTAIKGIFTAANVGTTAYPFLSGANVNVIKNFGTEEQKRLFMEPQLTGRYMGTMALTEPQAGSSLSDIKTTATPGDAGSYRLSGNKIFISAGDHELSENIVHLVLARIKGAPPGVKGISLFIVPKYLVNEDGTLGEKRRPACRPHSQDGLPGHNIDHVELRRERRGRRLSGGRTQQRAFVHVPDDERGADRRWSRRGRSWLLGLPQRPRLRKGPSAGPPAAKQRSGSSAGPHYRTYRC